MAKNSIGQFIAALRKANGMTQQEVADRLNVSNKAVSRWERDECAPDLTVIPALAEMFGVTCDELLRGERITITDAPEKKDKKVEKQVKALISRTLSGFKMLIMISLGLSVVGLVCMFGISYGFYRPVIGFAVMLLFEACAALLSVLAVSRANDVKRYNELFEMANPNQVSQFNDALGTLSFWAFYVIFAVVALSLPLIMVESGYVNSVLTYNSYFTVFFGGIVLILILVYLKFKDPYLSWLISGKLPERPAEDVFKVQRKMSRTQILLMVLAGVLFVVAPYFDANPQEITFLYTVTVLIGLACLLANIIIFVVFILRQRADRVKLLIPGIRNVLFIPSAMVVSELHTMGWYNLAGDTAVERYDLWQTEYLWYALSWAAVVFILSSLLEIAVNRKHKSA